MFAGCDPLDNMPQASVTSIGGEAIQKRWRTCLSQGCRKNSHSLWKWCFIPIARAVQRTPRTCSAASIRQYLDQPNYVAAGAKSTAIGRRASRSWASLSPPQPPEAAREHWLRVRSSEQCFRPPPRSIPAALASASGPSGNADF